ncbi:hypothetical protein KC332_g9653 [Hortaea werneckii]|nr:hypothetical protein KC358_g10404 [Hortaea werneckii]KAI6919663.1 hypothetical protein KC348_g10564 [Hortaea werneckii]KAI6942823.1 hypothetical protein KC341_g1925 [Hortaea werneckii]KAI6981310.1 hypothetical protein KC321_g1296 [Hortaea werneckii]KAI7000377.1 hypothetical protein KC329_g472 [Hortaea werneckii]
MAGIPRNPVRAIRGVAEGQGDGSDSGSEAINDEQQDGGSYSVNKGVMISCGRFRRVIDVNEYTVLMGGEFQEPGLENAEETAVISKHYGHRDSPEPKNVGYQMGDRLIRGDKEEPVIVVFHDIDRCVGSFAKPTIYCEWQMNSQNPGLKLRIATPRGVVPKREAICCVPLAAMKRSFDDNGNLEVLCSMRFCRDEGIREDVGRAPVVAELVDHAHSDGLMQVHLELWQDPSKAPYFERGPQPCAISWRGLSLRELSDIDDNPDTQEEPYDAFEFMVSLFRRSRDWRIYRRWDSERTDSAWVLKSWIAKSLLLTAKYGEMWHYQLQLDNEQRLQPLFASDTSLGQLEPPRNLVIDWLTEIDEEGRAIGQPKAHRVYSYPVTRNTIVYGSPNVMSLQLRLAIERNRQFHTQILLSGFRTEKVDVIGTFNPLSERPGLYVVDLCVPDGRLLNLDCSLRVEAGTKVKIAVKASEFAKVRGGLLDIGPILFEGVVVGDIFGGGAEVTALVEGPSLEPYVELADGSVQLVVKVELQDDPTPTDRHQATIKEIEAGFQRTKGVDFGALILRAPPSIIETDSLARQMTQVLRGLVMGVANAFNLNDAQTEALSNATESSSGVTAICGPPGTGKSWSVAAIGYVHICIGKQLGGERRRPVLACAPANVAVDTLMSHFLAGTKHDGTFDDSDLVIVRYRGSLPHENLTLTKGLDPGDRAEPHARYDFYVQRQNKINEWADSEGHVMKDTARTFVYLNARICTSRSGREPSPEAARDLKTQFDEAEDLLTSYFLQHVVDIVFCTNNWSAQGMLRKWYRPKVLLSDELATCSIPDGSTPIGAFKEHIEHWTVAGDYPQQRPVLASYGRNEWADILLQSLFQWTVEPRLVDSSLVKLRTQYRMHPDLSDPLSIWYKDDDDNALIQNHASTSTLSAVWRRLKSFLRVGFGNVRFNGRRRLIIDVSGHDDEGEPIRSDKHDASLTNRFEADVVAQLIQRALAYKSTPQRQLPGRDLLHSDFLVLSPHKSQCHLINQMLSNNGVNSGPAIVTCMSTGDVRGGSGEIIISSMVQNNPNKADDIGLVAEDALHCVLNSRAKQAMISVGNYSAWMRCQQLPGNEERRGMKPPIFDVKNGVYRRFGQLLRHISVHGDILAYEDFKAWSDGQQPFEGLEAAPKPGRKTKRGRRGGKKKRRAYDDEFPPLPAVQG